MVTSKEELEEYAAIAEGIEIPGITNHDLQMAEEYASFFDFEIPGVTVEDIEIAREWADECERGLAALKEARGLIAPQTPRPRKQSAPEPVRDRFPFRGIET